MLQWTWECRYLFKLVFWFSSDKYPEVELLDHIVVIFLIFWGISMLFSIAAAPLYILTNSAWRFPFLHILTSTCYSCLFDNSHYDRCEVISHRGLDLLFSSDDKHLLMYLLATYLSSLEKRLFRTSAHSLIRLFFAVDLYECFKCFGYSPFVRYMTCKYLLPFSSLLFHFVDGFLCCTESF